MFIDIIYYLTLSIIQLFINDDLKISISDEIDNLKEAFQDGCKKIVDKLTALGYPPVSPQGPDQINISIQNIYDTRYAQGYEDGVNKTTENAKIKYTYHKHTGSAEDGSGCYNTQTHVHNSKCKKIYDKQCGGFVPVDANDMAYGKCTKCGRECTGLFNGSYCHHPDLSSKWRYGCKNLPLNTWVLGCGKTEDSIEKVEIIFD